MTDAEELELLRDAMRSLKSLCKTCDDLATFSDEATAIVEETWRKIRLSGG